MCLSYKITDYKKKEKHHYMNNARYQVLIQTHPDEIRARRMSYRDVVNELISLRAVHEISTTNHSVVADEDDSDLELEFLAREPNQENFRTRVTVYGSQTDLHDLINSIHEAAPA